MIKSIKVVSIVCLRGEQRKLFGGEAKDEITFHRLFWPTWCIDGHFTVWLISTCKMFNTHFRGIFASDTINKHLWCETVSHTIRVHCVRWIYKEREWSHWRKCRNLNRKKGREADKRDGLKLKKMKRHFFCV